MLVRNALAFMLLWATPALADAPLPPPHRYEICTSSKSHCVVLDPRRDAVCYQMLPGGRKVVWRVPGWHRWGFLSDDGRNFAAGYEGFELLPLDYSPDAFVLRVWHDGRSHLDVRLRDVVHNRSLLRRTVSHLVWGSCRGFLTNDAFLLEAVDCPRVVIDLSRKTVTRTCGTPPHLPQHLSVPNPGVQRTRFARR